MRTFLALYRGPTVAEAELVALSADPTLVADVAARLLQQPDDAPSDPILDAKRRGDRRALQLVQAEAQERVQADAEEEPDGA